VTSASWRRKNNRLPPDRYIGNGAYFLTLTTEGRAVHFFERELVKKCEERLHQAAEFEGFTLLTYVFMPDHLHAPVQSENARLAGFMKRFKQQTAFEFKQANRLMLWQKSYFDRIVRADEDLNDIAQYVAANPVRAGIVTEWRLYPYRGSVLLDGKLAGDLKVAATSGEMAPL
jgi:putative transposase